MGGQYGTENIKKALKAGIGLGEALGKALEDGKLSFKDAFVVPGLVKDLKDVPKINFKDMKDEFGELDAQDREEIKEFFKNEFDIPQDKLEVKIEDAFELLVEGSDIILGGYSYGMKVKDFIKDLKN